MINLLKKWHIIHSWSKRVTRKTEKVSFPWTPEECYAYERTVQSRVCSKCDKLQTRIIRS